MLLLAPNWRLCDFLSHHDGRLGPPAHAHRGESKDTSRGSALCLCLYPALPSEPTQQPTSQPLCAMALPIPSATHHPARPSSDASPQNLPGRSQHSGLSLLCFPPGPVAEDFVRLEGPGWLISSRNPKRPTLCLPIPVYKVGRYLLVCPLGKHMKSSWCSVYDFALLTDLQSDTGSFLDPLRQPT